MSEYCKEYDAQWAASHMSGVNRLLVDPLNAVVRSEEAMQANYVLKDMLNIANELTANRKISEPEHLAFNYWLGLQLNPGLNSEANVIEADALYIDSKNLEKTARKVINRILAFQARRKV